MNLFMLTVLDEKEGYVKVKKDDLMKALSVVYNNGFEDAKEELTGKDIKPAKMCLIGTTGDKPWQI